MPKPSAIPNERSAVDRCNAFMLRQRKANRDNSITLTERINPLAMSGTSRIPLCEKETVEKLTRTEANSAQRKTTMPNFVRPEKAESTERKTSIQTKKRSTALA